MNDRLIEIFTHFTQMSLGPVLTLVAVSCGLTIMAIGGVFREWLQRRFFRSKWAQFTADLKADRAEPARWVDSATSGLPSWALRQLGGNISVPRLRAIIPDVECEAGARLTWLSVGIRVGPMLGLAGTLIPMGPAMDALTEGNTAAIGTNLNVAFSVTILGLFIGAGSYACHMCRRTWYEMDLTALELVAHSAAEQQKL